jgi:hypothetical protein
MPLSISYFEGTGVSDNQIAVAVTLPDTNGGSLVVEGGVIPAGGASQKVGPTTLTLPAAPGSGSIYLNVQVDVTSGVATLQQSTTAPPVAINGNNVIVYSMTIPAGVSDDALDAGVTPDPAAGQS